MVLIRYTNGSPLSGRVGSLSDTHVMHTSTSFSRYMGGMVDILVYAVGGREGEGLGGPGVIRYTGFSIRIPLRVLGGVLYD